MEHTPFDFNDPNPSFSKDFDEISKKMRQYYEDCVLKKKNEILVMSREQRLDWARKALINAAANYVIVSHYILEEEMPGSESMFYDLNLIHSGISSQYIVPLIALIVSKKLDKTKEIELAELNRMMGIKSDD